MELRTGYLPVGIDHQIYFEDVGSTKLEPLIFVHGGPGSGFEEKHRAAVDTSKYRVILFDQRGCGKSHTVGELNDNTTDFIIKDIETIRKRLKIEKLSLLGSSWGAVPATGYAAQFPERVNKLILKSPFLARNADFLWAYTHEGVAKLLPQDWTFFSQYSLKSLEGDELIEKYYREIIHDTDETAMLRWLNWEGAQYFFSRTSEKAYFTPETLTPYWKNVARIQVHYTKNHFFLGEQGILPWIEKIATTSIQGVCLQGDKDIITPPRASALIKELWPSLDYRIVAGADHKIPEEELLKL